MVIYQLSLYTLKKKKNPAHISKPLVSIQHMACLMVSAPLILFNKCYKLKTRQVGIKKYWNILKLPALPGNKMMAIKNNKGY